MRARWILQFHSSQGSLSGTHAGAGIVDEEVVEDAGPGCAQREPKSESGTDEKKILNLICAI